jgi:hypothetical protein
VDFNAVARDKKALVLRDILGSDINRLTASANKTTSGRYLDFYILIRRQPAIGSVPPQHIFAGLAESDLCFPLAIRRRWWRRPVRRPLGISASARIFPRFDLVGAELDRIPIAPVQE